MKKGIVLLSAVALLTLSSCNGTKKVGFEDFQKEVIALKDVSMPAIESVKISGKYDGSKYNFKYSKDALGDLSMKELLVYGIISGFNLAEFSLIENSDMTYYVGNGFKVQTEEMKVAFDKYGHTTAVSGTASKVRVDLKASYDYK